VCGRSTRTRTVAISFPSVRPSLAALRSQRDVSLRIALAQLNTVVGDIPGNAAKVEDAIARATDAGADVILTPECALTGYPPEDLLLRPDFARASRAALDALALGVHRGVAVVGFVEWDGDCHNSAAVVADGRVQAIYRKRFLPNYGVFDEARYFAAGREQMVLDIQGARVGIVICEDIWYSEPVAGDLALARLDLICCISASPFHSGKGDGRERMLGTRAGDSAAALAFCNQVGGQDELVFDGRSAVFDAGGELLARAPQFEEDLLLAEIDVGMSMRRRLMAPLIRRVDRSSVPAPVSITSTPGLNGSRPTATAAPLRDEIGELWAALVCGLRDYVDKNGFPGVVVGLSGGIDSALTAALAVDALGAGRVRGVSLPSRYTSDRSQEDASALAESLGIELLVVPIAPVVDALEEALEDTFAGRSADATEENLQARARGTLLMGISNKLGPLVLATGNKSEMSVGYSTLYGDMVGGFAPLRDVYKTRVYRLARWKNEQEGREVIPASTIERPPTAELRPGQLDSDSLPPYDVLDRILEGYVEQDLGVDELVARGLPMEVSATVIRMVERAEYKRRQGPVGIKITPRAFGRDRRMPITNRYSL
jgi:NAD+ synthase (glutamine-hydrolysing)